MARFNESGTEPVERQLLTISVNTGAISSIHSSSSEVGVGSRSQVLGDIFCKISGISAHGTVVTSAVTVGLPHHKKESVAEGGGRQVQVTTSQYVQRAEVTVLYLQCNSQSQRKIVI